MELTGAAPFEEAIQKIATKTTIGSKLNSREWADVPVALRERAFFSSRVESSRFLQSSRDALRDFLSSAREKVTLPNGTETTALKVGSRADFVMQMRELAIREGMGDLVPEEKRGGLEDITSRRRLETIFDTQTISAWEYGNWKQGQDPDVIDEFPAQRFIRERDVKKPRPIHQSNEGVVRRKDDLEFWTAMNSESFGGFGVPWGPWGFGSGMGTEDVDRSTAEQIGLVSPDEVVQPYEKQFNDGLKASVTGLDSDIVAKLRDAFGDQVSTTGDEIRWSSNQPPPPPAPAIQPPPPTVGPPQTVPLPHPVHTPRARVPASRIPPGLPLVSDAVDLNGAKRMTAPARTALDAINQVHGDGTIESFPVVSGAGRAEGVTSVVRRLGSKRLAIQHVGLNGSGISPEFTMVHEVAHVLDIGPLGGYAAMATHTAGSPLQPILEAIRKTAAHAQLTQLAKQYSEVRNYLLTPHELFARAYSQWVAIRSQDPKLMSGLEAFRNLKTSVPYQWADADFSPVADAFDAAFKTIGWSK